MIKLLIGVLILVSSYLVAKNKAETVKERYYYFNSLVNSCELINADLLYKKRPVKEILNAKYQSFTFLETLNAYFDGGEKLPKFLSYEETVLVKEYLCILGKGDTNSQINAINFYKQEFLKIATEKKNEYNHTKH